MTAKELAVDVTEHLVGSIDMVVIKVINILSKTLLAFNQIERETEKTKIILLISLCSFKNLEIMLDQSNH